MDRKLKWAVYAEHGVARYWLVDPLARTLEAYELQAGGNVLTDRCSGDEEFCPALFPGLTIPLAALWV